MCHNRETKEAFMMLDFMRKNNITPTLQTAAPILKLIEKDADAIDGAWAMLEDIRAEGHDVDVLALNTVLQAAVGLRDLQRAIGTYKAASQVGVTPDVDSYNILLEGCVATAHRELGDRILADMKEAGVKPDSRTYENMIGLCIRQSTYEDAFFYLEEMKSLKMVRQGLTKSKCGQSCTGIGGLVSGDAFVAWAPR